MGNDKLVFIIPTVSRTGYISRLLESIRRQSVIPNEILIVDSGPVDILETLKNYSRDMNIRYIIARPPSLTKQRNLGISKISESINLVGFLDDDIVLEKDSLRNMLRFWETAAPDIGGASFNNIFYSYKKPSIIEYIFLVNSFQRGKILKSGFNSTISAIDSTKCVDWLFGGITVWRRKVVEEFKFDEWFTDNAFCDDIDYSYRVGKKYKIMVVEDAKVRHLVSQRDYNDEFIFGKTIITNKIYFVKKHQEFSLAFCYWGCFGVCLSNLIKGTLKFDKRYLKRSFGNFIALCKSLIGNKAKC